MGNRITSDRVPGSPHVKMNNELSEVFFDVLLLTAIRHGRSIWERKLTNWLVEHDQDLSGRGNVGFDVSHLGWSEESFDEQRRFLLRIIDAALSREGWRRLPYSPAKDLILPRLRTFREMIEQFPREAIHPKFDPETTWIPRDLPTHGSCKVHRVLMHEGGCSFCNHSPLDAPPKRTPHRTPPRPRPT